VGFKQDKNEEKIKIYILLYKILYVTPFPYFSFPMAFMTLW
jgi:hypothetical protein